MSCKNCSEYDALCKGGWCDRHRISVLPTGTCEYDDECIIILGENECSTCTFSVKINQIMYCYKHRVEVSPFQSCEYYTE